MDFDKLNPHSVNHEVASLALQKLQIKSKNNLVSQTMPLQGKIHSHRDHDNKRRYDHHRDKLQMKDHTQG